MNTDDNKFRGSDLSYFSSSLKDKWRIIKSKIKENKKTYNLIMFLMKFCRKNFRKRNYSNNYF